jgi:hypothetical protein
MADNNSKNGADETGSHLEDFDGVDWGSDTVSTAAPAATSKSSLFDEDDPFADRNRT